MLITDTYATTDITRIKRVMAIVEQGKSIVESAYDDCEYKRGALSALSDVLRVLRLHSGVDESELGRLIHD